MSWIHENNHGVLNIIHNLAKLCIQVRKCNYYTFFPVHQITQFSDVKGERLMRWYFYSGDILILACYMYNVSVKSVFTSRTRFTSYFVKWTINNGGKWCRDWNYQPGDNNEEIQSIPGFGQIGAFGAPNAHGSHLDQHLEGEEGKDEIIEYLKYLTPGTRTHFIRTWVIHAQRYAIQ